MSIIKSIHEVLYLKKNQFLFGDWLKYFLILTDVTIKNTKR